MLDGTKCLSCQDDLGSRGVRQLVVEAGMQVHTAFLSNNLVDEIHLAVAPIVVGSADAPAFLGRQRTQVGLRGGCGRYRFRRRRHTAASSSDDSGFVLVTHPFHPLSGQRLGVLYVKRRAGDTVFVCSGGVSGQITVPRAWTDRGESPQGHRLSAVGLAALTAVTRALGVVD
jgi:RibD domain-containing protein/uncharacterized protein DUF5372